MFQKSSLLFVEKYKSTFPFSKHPLKIILYKIKGYGFATTL